MIRVLVVDDNDFVRKSVVCVLNQADGIEVVAECSDGIDVAAVAEDVRPDVVVMDLQMPIMSGIDAAWILRSTQPSARVLILSGLLTARSVQEAAGAGASGYLQKNGDAITLVKAVRTIAAGGTQWPRDRVLAGSHLLDSARR